MSDEGEQHHVGGLPSFRQYASPTAFLPIFWQLNRQGGNCNTSELHENTLKVTLDRYLHDESLPSPMCCDICDTYSRLEMPRITPPAHKSTCHWTSSLASASKSHRSSASSWNHLRHLHGLLPSGTSLPHTTLHCNTLALQSLCGLYYAPLFSSRLNVS